LSAVSGSVSSESLKPVLPDIHEIISSDIPLYQFRPVFNIQTRADISVASYAGREDSCSAQKVMIPNHALVLNAEVVRATECYFHSAVRIESLIANIGKQI
jgi:hypothetical protein